MLTCDNQPLTPLQEALFGVARNSIEDLDAPHDIKTSVIQMCVNIYQSVERASTEYKQVLNRHNYVTPISYLELLSLFRRILEEKRITFEGLKGRLQIGVEQLLATAQQVAGLQEELEATRPLLQQASRETEDTMLQIQQDKQSADETRRTVMHEEEKAENEANETKAIAADAKRYVSSIL